MAIMNYNKFKNEDEPVTIWGTIRDRYWDFKSWFRYTAIGSWYNYRIEGKYLYPIRCWFNPRHKKLRKSIPNQWWDSVELIHIINFAIITEFYEDEFSAGIVNYDSDEYHKNFANWLEKAYTYITEIRPRLEKGMDEAYPPLGENPFDEINVSKEPYEVKYAAVIAYEKEIEETDTQILNDLIKYRAFFWT